MNLKTLNSKEELSTSLPIEKKSAPLFLLILHNIFKFFASLQLAIFILFSLMTSLAVGTFLESGYGTDTARILIYQSPWFGLILLVLGINLAAAALDRIPWKKKHVGFVITHIGIIMILIGSWMTQKTMVDGQMVIAEGETVHRMTVPEPLLYIVDAGAAAGQGKDWLVSLQKQAFAWQGKKEILRQRDESGKDFSISLTADYPKARMAESIVQDEQGPPAIKLTIHNSFVNQSQWLMENDATLGEIQMGPAKFKFAKELLKESKEPAPASGYLEVQLKSSSFQLPFSPDLKLPATLPLGETGYTVQILKLFKNAAVSGKELVEQAEKAGEEMKNPAAQIILQGPALEERHTVFAKFPDFPTVHGMKPSAVGAKMFYRLPGGGSRGQDHELRFVNTPEGLKYQIKSGMEVKTGKAVSGEEVSTGWMDLRFKVDSFYPHATIARNFSPEPNISQSEEALPAIRVRFESPQEQKEIWLRQGSKEKVRFGEGSYELLYGQKTMPAGFKLKLRDFKVENYPGTERPASFESDVTLKDDARGTSKDVTISMNKPLSYRGFHIYQSGYSLEQGQPEVSIFSVGKDPGVPLKYAGAIVMVAGIIIMFYTRKFSSTGGQL